MTFPMTFWILASRINPVFNNSFSMAYNKSIAFAKAIVQNMRFMY